MRWGGVLTTQSSMSPYCAKCVLNSSSSNSPCTGQEAARLLRRWHPARRPPCRMPATRPQHTLLQPAAPLQASHERLHRTATVHCNWGGPRRRKAARRELTVPPTNILRVRPLAPPLLLGTAALASTLLPSMSCSLFCTPNSAAGNQQPVFCAGSSAERRLIVGSEHCTLEWSPPTRSAVLQARRAST